MFERKGGNPTAMLNLEDRKERLSKRYKNISSDAEKIHEHIKVKLCVTK